MSLRFSINEAQKLGLISKEQAREQRSVIQSQGRNNKPLSNLVCSIDGDTPQQILWRAVCTQWPGKWLWEAENLIPDRRFRIDLYHPESKLAVEVDGWQWHGKYLADFKRDREKQNLLTLNGIRILRFYASEITGTLDTVLKTISVAMSHEN